jgi:hypothetical protein
MNGSNGFLIAAYVVMWIGLLGYAIRLHRVFRDSRQRLNAASQGDGRTT